MKVLGIYGSPRKGGNSDLLMDEAVQAASEVGAKAVKVYCRKLKMGGCLNCGGCDKTGNCVLKDDMQSVYPLLDDADAIILSVPMFFYAAPAQAKALVDRCQARWSRRMLTKTKEQRKHYDRGKGYLIGVGATKGDNLFQGAELMAKYFYDALDMSYEGGLLLRGLEGKDAGNERPETLEQARALGLRIVAAQASTL
jgi:multimeric flavodoxin WrbA